MSVNSYDETKTELFSQQAVQIRIDQKIRLFTDTRSFFQFQNTVVTHLNFGRNCEIKLIVNIFHCRLRKLVRKEIVRSPHKGKLSINSFQSFLQNLLPHWTQTLLLMCNISLFFYSPVTTVVMHDIVLIYYKPEGAQYPVIYLFFCFYKCFFCFRKKFTTYAKQQLRYHGIQGKCFAQWC